MDTLCVSQPPSHISPRDFKDDEFWRRPGNSIYRREQSRIDIGADTSRMRTAHRSGNKISNIPLPASCPICPPISFQLYYVHVNLLSLRIKFHACGFQPYFRFSDHIRCSHLAAVYHSPLCLNGIYSQVCRGTNCFNEAQLSVFFHGSHSVQYYV